MWQPHPLGTSWYIVLEVPKDAPGLTLGRGTDEGGGDACKHTCVYWVETH